MSVYAKLSNKLIAIILDDRLIYARILFCILLKISSILYTKYHKPLRPIRLFNNPSIKHPRKK